MALCVEDIYLQIRNFWLQVYKVITLWENEEAVCIFFLIQLSLFARFEEVHKKEKFEDTTDMWNRISKKNWQYND
jgi:hypothetical protein